MKDLIYVLLIALLLALVLVPTCFHRRGNGSGGLDIAKGAVINIKQRKNDLWRVELYSGEVRTRMPNGELDQTEVCAVYVDGKVKDAHTGRPAIEEFRELLESQEIVHIRAKLDQGICTEVRIQKGSGRRLKVEDTVGATPKPVAAQRHRIRRQRSNLRSHSAALGFGRGFLRRLGTGYTPFSRSNSA
jgi:hypothetical protein